MCLRLLRVLVLVISGQLLTAVASVAQPPSTFNLPWTPHSPAGEDELWIPDISNEEIVCRRARILALLAQDLAPSLVSLGLTHQAAKGYLSEFKARIDECVANPDFRLPDLRPPLPPPLGTYSGYLRFQALLDQYIDALGAQCGAIEPIARITSREHFEELLPTAVFGACPVGGTRGTSIGELPIPPTPKASAMQCLMQVADLATAKCNTNPVSSAGPPGDPNKPSNGKPPKFMDKTWIDHNSLPLLQTADEKHSSGPLPNNGTATWKEEVERGIEGEEVAKIISWEIKLVDGRTWYGKVYESPTGKVYYTEEGRLNNYGWGIAETRCNYVTADNAGCSTVHGVGYVPLVATDVYNSFIAPFFPFIDAAKSAADIKEVLEDDNDGQQSPSNGDGKPDREQQCVHFGSPAGNMFYRDYLGEDLDVYEMLNDCLCQTRAEQCPNCPPRAGCQSEETERREECLRLYGSGTPADDNPNPSIPIEDCLQYLYTDNPAVNLEAQLCSQVQCANPVSQRLPTITAGAELGCGCYSNVGTGAPGNGQGQCSTMLCDAGGCQCREQAGQRICGCTSPSPASTGPEPPPPPVLLDLPRLPGPGPMNPPVPPSP